MPKGVKHDPLRRMNCSKRFSRAFSLAWLVLINQPSNKICVSTNT